MSVIEHASDIELAYRKTKLRALFWNVLCNAQLAIRICCWAGLIIGIVTLGYLLMDRDAEVQYWLILSATLLGVGLDFGLKDCYSNHYSDYPVLIQSHYKNRKFLRYLIFRDSLPDQLIDNHSQIIAAKSLVKKEMELEKLPVFSKHPFTIVVLGMLTAMLGGAASNGSFWTTGAAGYVVIPLLFMLCINYYVLEIFPSRAYRTLELEQFLLWLEHHADEPTA